MDKKGKKVIVGVACIVVVAGVITLGVLNKDKIFNICYITTPSTTLSNYSDIFNSFVTKKYLGKLTQPDSNNEDSSSITNYYTLTFTSDNNCSIEIKTLYKAKENTIKINSINITNTDAAAGTSYVDFIFTGSDNNKNTYYGSGTISYSNVVNDNKIGLKLDVNQKIFNGISVSTEFIDLELSNN